MNKACAILQREYHIFWYSPIAYIVLTVFLVVMNFFFFADFFVQGNASLTGLFGFMPLAFLFVIPALTMRLWAEEKKSGTIELLMTKPVSDWEVVGGKYLASALLLLVLLALTLPTVLTVMLLSQNGLDLGVVLTSYFGAFLLGLAYLAIGSWVSAITENQIVAFILGVVITFLFLIVGQITMLVASPLVQPLEYLSLGKHYSSVARGVIDSRDLIYYASMIFLFLFLTVRAVQSRKWG